MCDPCWPGPESHRTTVTKISSITRFLHQQFAHVVLQYLCLYITWHKCMSNLLCYVNDFARNFVPILRCLFLHSSSTCTRTSVSWPAKKLLWRGELYSSEKTPLFFFFFFKFSFSQPLKIGSATIKLKFSFCVKWHLKHGLNLMSPTITWAFTIF